MDDPVQAGGEFQLDEVIPILDGLTIKTLAKCSCVSNVVNGTIQYYFGKNVDIERAWRCRGIVPKVITPNIGEELEVCNAMKCGDMIAMGTLNGITLRSAFTDQSWSTPDDERQVVVCLLDDLVFGTKGDGIIHIFSVPKLEEKASFNVGFKVNVVVDAGEYLAVGGEYGALDIWRKKIWTRVGNLCDDMVENNSLDIITMDFDKNSSLLVCGLRSGDITIWNLETNTLRKVLRGHTEKVEGIVVGSGLIHSISPDRTIRRWSLVTGECLRMSEVPRLWPTRMVITGNKFAYCTSSWITGRSEVCVGVCDTYELVNRFTFEGSMVALHLEKDKLTGVKSNGEIVVWDVGSYAPKKKVFLPKVSLRMK